MAAGMPTRLVDQLRAYLSNVHYPLTVHSSSLLIGPMPVCITPICWPTITWLEVPVKWEEISEADAIVEADHPEMYAEPSQGSHFFHNITTMGISYLTVSHNKGDRIDWPWLNEQPRKMETDYVAVVHLDRPFVLKVDGRQSRAAIF